MDRKLLVEVISPEKVLYAAEADMVVATTPLGEVGILPLHIPLVSTLVTGEVRVKHGDHIDYFFIDGGFLEVKEDRVIILSPGAESAAEIEPEAEERAAEELRRTIEEAREKGEEIEDLQKELQKLIARIRVSKKAKQ